MEFTNDPKRLKEARIDALRRLVILFFLGFAIGMVPVCLTFNNSGQRLFIIGTTFILAALTVFLIPFLSRNKFNSLFNAYLVNIDDQYIHIKRNNKDQRIDKKSITKITRDKSGVIFIHQGFTKNGISKFLNKGDEFIKELEKIKPIEKFSKTFIYIQYLPLIFLLGLQLSRFIPSSWYYLIVGSLFVLCTVFNILYSIISERKGFSFIVSILFYAYLIYAVSLNLYKLYLNLFN